MSSFIDLTDIFKPPLSAAGQATSRMQGDKENTFSQSLAADNSDDAVEWVRTRLEILDFRVKSSELTPTITHCLQQLLMERQNLRQKCEELVDDCAQMHAQSEHGGKENEILENQVLILKQDVGVTQMQLEALQNEQREIKARFLQEKSELETRCFQLQALETQHLATLRKTEKDFGKLQDQLQKMMRSTDKNRSSSIAMSAAAPSNRTRAAANVFVADRKEQLSVAALREANAIVLDENEKLRDLLGSIVEDFDALNARADELERQSTPDESAMQRPASAGNESAGGAAVPPSPMAELVNPRNKPLNWLRDHLDGNMFKLRQRILARAKPAAASTAETVVSTPGAAIAEIDPTLSKMKDLARRLRQAEQVVVEQDKLITAALLCQLPITPSDEAAHTRDDGMEIQWTAQDQRDIIETKRKLEVELEYLEEQKTRLKLASRNLSASASAKKASLVKQYDLTELAGTRQQLGNMFDSPVRHTSTVEPGSSRRLSFGDFLPPVTPDTYAALREAGLPLPRMVSKDSSQL